VPFFSLVADNFLLPCNNLSTSVDFRSTDERLFALGELHGTYSRVNTFGIGLFELGVGDSDLHVFSGDFMRV